ncbi:DEAD/DEAH box helicase family protein [Bombilactobacillus folatiphilus]|uniref:DEAD/DEAH box helicase family protein n=1 Tax=Bombilactobacillus folatiphilus TaxID=2923362 RepID=A0ABY4P7X8_9LACO|nr:DEAD/DEAH box helicase family protein [Bombilactobacillus folatiphilus]UQS81815.1 DEAD/DEAH box helicase family protein [Bombilactobacillus folatiphilus]
MKIKFDTLDYQTQAVNAAVNVLNGQFVKELNFTVSDTSPEIDFLSEDGIGIGNHIIIDDETMLHNVNQVQLKNNIAPSKNLYGKNEHFPQFNIEMETGTGKTFVYLKTILELNKKYGFKKFVIVVPSVAIREGVLKTFNITKEYFRKQYDAVVYDLFVFDSSKLNRIRTFASANSIDIMVTTIQAFNKNSNVMNNENDQLSGVKPIDMVAETRPILIIDEPQSVDNTPTAKDAINKLNPAIGFRYSATHRDKSYPTIYRLNAVDAYNQQLVKQIEVSSLEVDENGNRDHLKLKSVKTGKNGISAKVEVYKKTKVGAKKTDITLKRGDNLFNKTKLEAYDNMGSVEDIDGTPGAEAVYFSGTPDKITLSSATLEDEQIKQMQIAKTIEEHLEKELTFKKACKRIKVLSLIFLDKVENYRTYDKDGNAVPGRYAKIFQEEYNHLISLPRYRELNDYDVPTAEVHDGYFSKDGKGKLKNSTKGESKADESTYETIMQDKEGLLTMYDPKHHTAKANKIRFIFSHSALKEGWDNPNVFQIATLIENKDEITKRQKIGRGLRIAVNEDGERVPGFDVNTLTVMANESYEDFAKGLQSEYEEDGVTFGIFTADTFSIIPLKYDPVTDEEEVLGELKAEQLLTELKQKDYITKQGRATGSLKKAINDQQINLSEEFQPIADKILAAAQNNIKKIDIKNATDKIPVTVEPEALSSDFQELWDRIKYKTNYKVDFNSDKFIHKVVNSSEGLNSIQTTRATLSYSKGTLDIGNAGIETSEVSEGADQLKYQVAYQLPDIVTHLQSSTNLTRRTIVKILTQVDNLDSFKNNPLSYMDQATNIINSVKNKFIVDGIVYYKNGDQFDQKLFTSEVLNAYKNHDFKVDLAKHKTLTDYIVTDSDVEKRFAEDAEKDDGVRFYMKLPDWFKIRTPLGSYNPDWAILYEKAGEQHLYFIVETKGNINFDELRPRESEKIAAGKKHFAALDTGITFKKATEEKDIRE